MARERAFWLSCALIVLGCNVLDAAFTLCAINFGDAVEANPLMAVLLAAGPLWFVIVKHVLVSLGIILLWRLRARPLAQWGACLALTVYPLLVAYEALHVT